MNPSHMRDGIGAGMCAVISISFASDSGIRSPGAGSLDETAPVETSFGALVLRKVIARTI
jgi:hypothetical protein